MAKIYPLLFILEFFFSRINAEVADSNSTYNQSKREFQIMISDALPVGSFGNDYQLTYNFPLQQSLMMSMQGETGGMGATNGFGIEVSEYIFYNKKPVQTSGGLKITFISFSSIPFKWYTPGTYVYNNADYTNMNFLSFKIGPAIRIAVGKESAFRFYDQVAAVVGWNGSWHNVLNYSYYDDHNNRYDIHDESTFTMHSGTGLKNEIGVDFSANWFMMGLGFSFGNLTFKNVSFVRNAALAAYQYNPNNSSYNYYSSTNLSGDVTLNPQMPISILSFSIGCKL